VGTLLYLVFRPPSADKLYQQAKAVMQSGNADAQENAIDLNGAITNYLYYYGKQDNEQSREVRGWKEQIQIARWERLLDKHLRQERENKLIKIKPDGETQEDAFKAVDAEEKGDRDTAVKHWQAIKERERESSWAAVADKHLAQWNALAQINEQFQQMHERIHNSGEEPSLTNNLLRQAFLAWRAKPKPSKEGVDEGVGDGGVAKSLFKALKAETTQQGDSRQLWYLYAVWNIHELGDAVTDKEKLQKKVRERIKDMRGQLAQKSPKILRKDVRLVCLDVRALYGEDADMKEVVKEAEKFLQDIPK
ncbi:MAG: hypothetical protein ACRELF_14835, partial [Gemmataceae bacterium]